MTTLSDPEVTACDESEAAFRRHFDAMMVKWRARVTRKATSLFFGNLLRHVGPDVADLLYGEWKGMDANERVDLLRRTAELQHFLEAGDADLIAPRTQP